MDGRTEGGTDGLTDGRTDITRLRRRVEADDKDFELHMLSACTKHE